MSNEKKAGSGQGEPSQNSFAARRLAVQGELAKRLSAIPTGAFHPLVHPTKESKESVQTQQEKKTVTSGITIPPLVSSLKKATKEDTERAASPELLPCLVKFRAKIGPRRRPPSWRRSRYFSARRSDSFSGEQSSFEGCQRLSTSSSSSTCSFKSAASEVEEEMIVNESNNEETRSAASDLLPDT